MRIKLDCISPYTPFKLKIYDSVSKTIKVMNLGSGSSKYWVGLKTVVRNCNYHNTKDVYKPILKLLSEIEKDKNFFRFVDEQLFCGTWKFESEGIVNVLSILTSEGLRINIVQNSEIAAECPYIFYEYFIKNHYDINGLIPKGLAIDSNTLN